METYELDECENTGPSYPVIETVDASQVSEEAIKEYNERTAKQSKSRRGHNPRTIDELSEISVTDMTPAELQKYATYLREENNMLHGQLITLRDSFEGVQKQKQEIETEYQQLKRAALVQIQFCKDTVAQAYKTLTYMSPLEA